MSAELINLDLVASSAARVKETAVDVFRDAHVEFEHIRKKLLPKFGRNEDGSLWSSNAKTLLELVRASSTTVAVPANTDLKLVLKPMQKVRLITLHCDGLDETQRLV